VIRSGNGDGGILHGQIILSFVDAVMGMDPAAISAARHAVVDAIGEAGMVDAAAVMAMFQFNTRAADAAGIPLETFFGAEERLEVGRRLGFEL